MDRVGVIEALLIILSLGVIFYLLRLYRVIKLEKRIGSFAIVNKYDKEESLLDKCYNLFWKLITKISKVLNKSYFLSNYGKRYQKYIIYTDLNTKKGIDYVSIKIFLAFSISLLALFTKLYHQIKINYMLFLVIFVISFYLLDIILAFLYNVRRKKIENDLLKAIMIMNNAFKSGKTIMQAVAIVKDEMDGPIQDEFKKIYLDITYGLGLDVVFERFYERVKLKDAKYISSTLTLLNKTGGDIVSVFNMIEKSIIGRKKLQNELASLTSSSRFVFKLLVGLPIVLILTIYILNPTYFIPLFNNPIGIMITIFTILLYILYILVIRKILKVNI